MDSIATGAMNTEALAIFYEKFGFKGLARALGGAASGNAPAKSTPAGGSSKTSAREPDLFDEPDDSSAVPTSQVSSVVYDTVLTWASFDQWLARVEAADLVAVDTETTSLDDMRAEIVGVSFSVKPGEAAYIPVAHRYPDAPEQLPREEVLAKLKPWLENGAKKKLGQNIKYDRHVFANHGIEVQGYAHDTMLQSYVLEVHKPHGLSSLAERHLGRSGISFEDLCGKGVNQICFDQVDIAKAAEYSCEDSDQTLDVHLALWPQLEADDKLRFIYELEIASSESLYRIERNGVLIDAPTLAAQSHELGARILQLETEAHALAGQPFNLSSPKQIGEIFFTKLGLPIVKKTATGAPSTDEEVLEKLAEDFPAAGQDFGAPGLGQAEGHLHRQAGSARPPAHGSRAHPLCAGRGGDRALVQQRPQFAEHPDSHA